MQPKGFLREKIHGDTKKQKEKLSLCVLKTITYKNTDIDVEIDIEALNKSFQHICIFDSNTKKNKNKHLNKSKIIALDSIQDLKITNSKNALAELQKFINEKKGWKFGYLSYDIKNEIENLTSDNNDGLKFPTLHFFVPKVVLQVDSESISVSYDDEFTLKYEAENIYQLCINSASKKIKNKTTSPIIKAKINRGEYIKTINTLKQEIHKGNIYEVNFCQEFFAENAKINPPGIYKRLNNISRAPFTAFCKLNEHYAICASPERYIQKRGNELISQPIKGTIKRSEDNTEDEQLKRTLQQNKKEQSENVMIVDLIRNDLSRIAKPKSVNVDELFEIYTFEQLHQMISTIRCEISPKVSFTDIIKSTFPMGSMTGAPKVSAMRLIEQYESTKRGLYSGTIGYIDPNGDFDFNVVIRSILYNSKSSYLSFMVGSAITDKANAEEEYEECLLKAKAMFEVLKD